MAFDFPATPATGDLFTDGRKAWIYNGTGWRVYGPDAGVVLVSTKTASYVAVAADMGTVVEMNVGSANTFTVPPSTFPVGATLDVVQYGAGQTTITPGSGVTLRSASGALKLTVQYSACSMYQRASNEWVVMGDLTT